MESDEALIKRYLDGEQTAFELLVRRHQDPLFGFVYRLTRNQDDAMDICQSTFVQAFINLHKLRIGGSFRAWLYQIALNFVRSNSKLSQRYEVSADSELVDNIIDTSLQPDEQAMLKQTQLLAAGLLNRLPAQQRLTVNLRFYQGLSFQEIAEVMELSLGTVKASYHQAIKNLRKFVTDGAKVTANEL